MSVDSPEPSTPKPRQRRKKIELLYPNVPDDVRGEEDAAELLVDWVQVAYDDLAEQPRLPAFLLRLPGAPPPGPPQFEPGASREPYLRVSKLLWAWIVIASRDPDIATVHGVTVTPTDDAYFRLEREAFDFLNNLLRRYATFDRSVFLTEARQLWHEIAGGTETYEIGAPLYTVRLLASALAIDLGPNLQLHRIEGSWASERFGLTRPLPPDRWAVTASITRKRGLAYIPRWLNKDEETEKALLERALLPVRLIRPTGAHAVFGRRYRIGIQAYRRPTERGSLDRTTWRGFATRLWPRLSKAESARSCKWVPYSCG